MTQNELDVRFTHHVPNDDQLEKCEHIRTCARTFADLINNLCPDSREKSTAMTKLEECVMWANASIAR